VTEAPKGRWGHTQTLEVASALRGSFVGSDPQALRAAGLFGRDEADLATDDGALMEPWGCNRWQSAANRLRCSSAKTSRIGCRGLPPPW